MAAPTLQGLTIGITADRRSDEQAHMLAQRGAKVVHGPVLRTMPVTDAAPAWSATDELLRRPPDVVIANTALGVRTWWSLAAGWGLDDELTDVVASSYVVSRGPKAAGALVALGIDVEWRSPSSTLADVVDHLLARGVERSRIALQLDGSGSTSSATRLEAAGAEVVVVPTYRWTLPRDPRPALRLLDAACAEKLDAVTFTAAPAVHNLFALARQEGLDAKLRSALNGPVLAMCVGPVCRAAASEHGVDAAFEPPAARLGTMVKALADHLGQRRRVVLVDNVELELQGALVRARGAGVLLAGRERELFELLVRRPGAVCPRTTMLAEVWGDRSMDAHALEVAIGRLRRTLSETGLTVEAIPRRGYRLTAGPKRRVG